MGRGRNEMVNIINIISHMIDSLDLYEDAMEKDITKRNYLGVCSESKQLLRSLGEDCLNDWNLKNNSKELKRGLHALKTLSDQLDQDVIDEGIVKSSYRKFKENSPVLMRELLEYYMMNKE
tara:strand:- start:559 stop:921 length:363 start_codon:yes stop_codon:yes gene_type:complete